MKGLHKLPIEIHQKILNYLYFTPEQHNRISPILYLIKNYKMIMIIQIESYLDTNITYKMILRWINLDHQNNIYDYLENLTDINYNLRDKTRQKLQNYKITNLLSIIELQNLYKYIFF